MLKIAKIDKFGRIVIPKGFRQSLGFHLDSIVFMEEKEDSLLLKPAHRKPGDIVDKIASMNLPVDDWEIMEKEIEKGRSDE